MCIMDGCFQFLAPRGDMFIAIATRKYPKAPEGRHVHRMSETWKQFNAKPQRRNGRREERDEPMNQ